MPESKKENRHNKHTEHTDNIGWFENTKKNHFLKKNEGGGKWGRRDLKDRW